ncbi:MAG: RagB/SusD family nutrient uptake outer membrane protein [Tannerella sp.]|jgi:hypothetical protein|nr:RagB/SusD family nutrient uptake outer membrane protein [Tannerella sp.]
MKVFNYMIGFLFLVLSCESVLDKHPYNRLSPHTFWKTESDALKGLTACYGRLNTTTFGSVGTGGCVIFWDALTDNMYANNYLGFPNIGNGVIQSTSGGLIANVWNDSYKGINTVNIFLENVENCEMNEDVRNTYKAEARFLRAFWYMHLVMCYGDVPKRVEAPAVNDILMARSPKSEIWEQIRADLDYAIEKLPNEKYTGHAVKGSALALKTKVLLFNEHWAEAIVTAKQLIDSSVFSLHPDYPGNFIRDGQENNSEILFSTKYLAPDMWHGIDLSLGFWGGCAPIAQFVDFFEKLDGWHEDAPYENRDPRLAMSIFYPGAPWAYDKENGFSSRKMNNNNTGFGLKKYIHTEVDNAGTTTESDQDFILLRYADVLLMYAEAMYKDGKGNDPSVLNAINEIRDRAGMYPVTAVTEEIIRYERRVELAFEGHRYYDLKRWKTAHTVIPQIENSNGQFRNFEEKHYLWPIPQAEIDINTLLKQNEGY